MKLYFRKLFKRFLILNLIFLATSINLSHEVEFVNNKIPGSDHLKKLQENDYILGEEDILLKSIVQDLVEINVAAENIGDIFSPLS